MTATARPLSPRQKQVVDLVRERRTNKEIAQAMGIKPQTVKVMLQQAFVRLGLHSRRDLWPAVAPETSEILRALKKITRQAESWHEFHHGAGTGIECDEICACIPICRAAIEKAVGRAL